MKLVKKIAQTVEQRILRDLPVGRMLYHDVTVGSTTVRRKTAVTFRWDGDDLMMDNTDTLTEEVKWLYLDLPWDWRCIWVGSRQPAQGFTPAWVEGGPNLLFEPKDKQGPKANFKLETFCDGVV